MTWEPERPTEVSCPACDALGGLTQARCTVCAGAGVVTVGTRADWLRANPPDRRPSMCPACAFAGVLVERLGPTRYRSKTCPCCGGSGVVTVARAREWRIAHVAGRPNE